LAALATWRLLRGCHLRISETRLGLIPSVISPYVIAAIGVRAARRYMLTAERFDAAKAEVLGLVSAVVSADQLMAEGARLADLLRQNGPQAVARQNLIAHVAGGRTMRNCVRDGATDRRVRATAEGQKACGLPRKAQAELARLNDPETSHRESGRDRLPHHSHGAATGRSHRRRLSEADATACMCSCR